MVVNNALGLDIGEKRIGVARVNMIARIPEPLVALANDDTFQSKLQQIIAEYEPDALIVGLPRNLNGEETPQTNYVKAFSQQNLTQYNVPILFQDETLSSVEAKTRLGGNLQPKGLVDAQAAAIILEDYIGTL